MGAELSILSFGLSSILNGSSRTIGHMTTMGARIKLALDESGVSQAEMARGCGIERSAVNQWCSDKTEPNPANVLAVADKTGFSLRWLVLEKGPKKETKKTDAQARLLWERYCEAADSVRRSIDILLQMEKPQSGSGSA